VQTGAAKRMQRTTGSICNSRTTGNVWWILKI